MSRDSRCGDVKPRTGDNRGAQRLRELFPERSAKRLADQVGVDQSVAGRWRSGDRSPEPKNRAKLEELYGIGWRLWDIRLKEEEPASERTPVPGKSGAA